MKYFNCGILGILAQQGHLIIQQIKKGNLDPIFRSNFTNYKSKSNLKVYKFNPISAFIYRVFTASYMDYLLKIDRDSIIKKMD